MYSDDIWEELDTHHQRFRGLSEQLDQQTKLLRLIMQVSYSLLACPLLVNHFSKYLLVVSQVLLMFAFTYFQICLDIMQTHYVAENGDQEWGNWVRWGSKVRRTEPPSPSTPAVELISWLNGQAFSRLLPGLMTSNLYCCYLLKTWISESQYVNLWNFSRNSFRMKIVSNKKYKFVWYACILRSFTRCCHDSRKKVYWCKSQYLDEWNKIMNIFRC